MTKQASVTGQKFRLTPRWIALGVALAPIVVFIAQNFSSVEVRFLFFETDTRLAVGLFASALLGFAAGLLISFRRRPD